MSSREDHVSRQDCNISLSTVLPKDLGASTTEQVQDDTSSSDESNDENEQIPIQNPLSQKRRFQNAKFEALYGPRL
jgi:hypothetical protein